MSRSDPAYPPMGVADALLHDVEPDSVALSRVIARFTRRS